MSQRPYAISIIKAFEVEPCSYSTLREAWKSTFYGINNLFW